jgi:orotate phosphoribosyltransferase
MAKVANDPAGWAQINQSLARMVQFYRSGRKIDVITGGETRDLIFSIPVANLLGLPHSIIRKEEKTHGVGGRFSPSLKKGAYVFHESDLMNTSASADEWINAIRNAGGDIEYYSAAFDRLQGGEEHLKAMNPPVKLISLVKKNKEFYDIGEEMGYVKDRAAVNKYITNQREWSKNYLLNHPGYLIDKIGFVEGHVDPKKKDGLEVLTKGYPELIPQLGPIVAKLFESNKVKDEVTEIGYMPKA